MSEPWILRAGDPRAGRAVAVLAHGEGTFLLPLFGAVQTGVFSLVWASDRQTSPSALRRALDTAGEPAVVLLDGDDGQPSAPEDWRCGRAALAWARAALIHGAAGERQHYATGALAAALIGRLLLVHCGGSEAASWATVAEAARLPTLIITPRPGVVHPQPAKADGPLQ
jgi:hypothetical protein